MAQACSIPVPTLNYSASTRVLKRLQRWVCRHLPSTRGPGDSNLTISGGRVGSDLPPDQLDREHLHLAHPTRADNSSRIVGIRQNRHQKPSSQFDSFPGALPNASQSYHTHLSPFLTVWGSITSDRWALSIIAHGYAIEFDSHPPVPVLRTHTPLPTSYNRSGHTTAERLDRTGSTSL